MEYGAFSAPVTVYITSEVGLLLYHNYEDPFARVEVYGENVPFD